MYIYIYAYNYTISSVLQGCYREGRLQQAQAPLEPAQRGVCKGRCVDKQLEGYIHMYTYIHTYMYTHVHVYEYIYIHINILIYMCIHVYMWLVLYLIIWLMSFGFCSYVEGCSDLAPVMVYSQAWPLGRDGTLFSWPRLLSCPFIAVPPTRAHSPKTWGPYV